MGELHCPWRGNTKLKIHDEWASFEWRFGSRVVPALAISSSFSLLETCVFRPVVSSLRQLHRAYFFDAGGGSAFAGSATISETVALIS